MASVEKAGYGHPGALAEIRRLALIRFDVSRVSRFFIRMSHTIYHQRCLSGQLIVGVWSFVSRRMIDEEK